MKRYKKRWVIFVSTLWALAILPYSAVSGSLDPYIEKAKKEGSVRIGITVRMTSHGKPTGKKYLKAFNDRYPFLKVEFKRIGGSRERERVFSEMAAGLFKYDVVVVSETMVPNVLKTKMARVTDWEKLGVSRILIHPDKVGVSLRTPVFGIAYNRELVSDKEAQTFTWETCTEPKWRGKTVMDDRPRHLNILYQDNGWGREKTLDYAKRWKANQPIMEASRSTAAQKLSVGAYPLICGSPRRQVKDLNVHAGVQSIGIVFPEPVPVGVGDVIYVPKKAKHPNAGILFLAWSATREAQNILDKTNFSGHPGFEGNEVRKVLKGKKVVYGSWKYSLRADAILAEILVTMGFPVVR
ncbi:MAG: extracellular solute-binding protein [Deltaproteobacteria bacterium]|nr:extracellular solute-binding protein [Deltaproteobacteria bacterium]